MPRHCVVAIPETERQSEELKLVEDILGDVHLRREVLGAPHKATDRLEALEFLVRYGAYLEAPGPDLSLSELNFRHVEGDDAFKLRQHKDWKAIPVFILPVIATRVDLAKVVNAIRIKGGSWSSADKPPRWS